MARVIPKGAAQIALWRSGMPQPLVFLTTEAAATSAEQAFRNGEGGFAFESWPSGDGIKGSHTFHCRDLVGVSVERNGVQLVGI